MADKKTVKCKAKGCNNPVLNREYCLKCTQVRKEKRNKWFAGAGVLGVPAIGYAIKKGALKQLPKIAKSLVKIIFRG